MNILQEGENTQSSNTCSQNFSTTPKLFNQNTLNDLVRDLELTKDKAEILASRLNERNLLEPGTKITFYRTRNCELRSYFTMENGLVFARNINDLLKQLDLPYESENWRLFIDSSKSGLKAVLLHSAGWIRRDVQRNLRKYEILIRKTRISPL